MTRIFVHLHSGLLSGNFMFMGERVLSHFQHMAYPLQMLSVRSKNPVLRLSRLVLWLIFGQGYRHWQQKPPSL